MTIREYKPEDREAVEKCSFELQELEKEIDPEIRVNSVEINRSYVVILLDRVEKQSGKIFVAENDGAIIGYVSVVIGGKPLPYENYKKYAYIYDISVLPEYRRQGIGKKLMDATEDFAKAQSADHIILDVLAKNQMARGFYIKDGFREGTISMIKNLNG